MTLRCICGRTISGDCPVCDHAAPRRRWRLRIGFGGAVMLALAFDLALLAIARQCAPLIS